MKKRQRKYDYLSVAPSVNVLINLLFIIISLICLIPFLIVISVSITEEKALIYDGYRLIPKVFSLDGYSFLMYDIKQILHSYGISVLVTVSGTTISLILISLYAYPLFRKDFPFRRFFSLFLFFTMLFNGGLVPFYILYTKYLGLKNNIIALILPYILNPFYVIVMRTFLKNTIHDSLIESSKLDGAKEMTILLRIVIPLALPAYATIALFTTLIYWNDWYMSLLFISNRENVSIQYYMFKTFQNMMYMLSNPTVSFNLDNKSLPTESMRMAMAVVGIGPIVIVYPFFQRYFIKGLTVGAVKG